MGLHGFPRCVDGDVEIHLCETDDRLVLLSDRLIYGSEFFEKSLSKKWNTSSESTIFPGGKNYHVYELRFDRGTAVATLYRKDRGDTHNTEMVRGSKDPLPAVVTHEEEVIHHDRLRVVKAHRGVLAALHSEDPGLSTSTLEDARTSILAVVDVAKYYGAENEVKLHIKYSLLLFRDEILEQCARAPVDMLELGTLTKCSWVFQEAATTLLGTTYDLWSAAQERLVSLGISELLKQKRQVLMNTLWQKEARIMCIMPKDEFNWVSLTAVNLVRHFLSVELSNGGGSCMGNGYAHTYKRLGYQSLSESFVHCPWVEGYLKAVLPHYEPAFLDDFRPHLRDLLVSTSQILQPLLQVATKRRVKAQSDLYYPLLFMRVDDDELPWT